MSAPARALTVRHVQLLRALFAAAAAVMITFSPDHSAAVGLAVFSGFVLTTALVMLLAVWLVYPAGQRWPSVVLALLGFAAGMTAGVPAWRTEDVFFVVVIAWAVGTGIVELVVGLRARRSGDATARDSIALGAFGLLLAFGAVAPQTWTVVLWMVPVVLLGFVASRFITPHLDKTRTKRLALGASLLGCALLVATQLVQLLG